MTGQRQVTDPDGVVDHDGNAVVEALRLVQLDDLQNVRRGEEFDVAVLGRRELSWPLSDAANSRVQHLDATR